MTRPSKTSYLWHWSPDGSGIRFKMFVCCKLLQMLLLIRDRLLCCCRDGDSEHAVGFRWDDFNKLVARAVDGCGYTNTSTGERICPADYVNTAQQYYKVQLVCADKCVAQVPPCQCEWETIITKSRVPVSGGLDITTERAFQPQPTGPEAPAGFLRKRPADGWWGTNGPGMTRNWYNAEDSHV